MVNEKSTALEKREKAKSHWEFWHIKVLHTASPCSKGTGQVTGGPGIYETVPAAVQTACKGSLTNVQVLFYIMAFKATFVNATDP